MFWIQYFELLTLTRQVNIIQQTPCDTWGTLKPWSLGIKATVGNGCKSKQTIMMSCGIVFFFLNAYANTKNDATQHNQNQIQNQTNNLLFNTFFCSLLFFVFWSYIYEFEYEYVMTAMPENPNGVENPRWFHRSHERNVKIAWVLLLLSLKYFMKDCTHISHTHPISIAFYRGAREFQRGWKNIKCSLCQRLRIQFFICWCYLCKSYHEN